MCSKKFEGVYLIKNHRNSLLFGYYKLGFHCLEHSLSIEHCFDLKDLNLNKRFEPLRKDLLFTHPNVPIVCSLRFQIRQQRLRNKHLFLGTSKAIRSKPNENCTARRKHGVKFATNCSE